MAGRKRRVPNEHDIHKKKRRKKPGAPLAYIDWELFETLCSLQCTQAEIAAVLKIHPDTLMSRVVKQYEWSYETVYKKFSSQGKCSLRRNQFNLSKTSAAMAIWLGKQYLGQRDQPEDTINNTDLVNKMEALVSQIRDAQESRSSEEEAEEGTEDRNGSEAETLHEEANYLISLSDREHETENRQYLKD